MFKITYDNYKILRQIESGVFDFGAPFYDAEGYASCVKLLNKIWPQLAEKLRSRTFVLCKTYMKAIEKSAPSFDKVIEKALGECTPINPAEYVDGDYVYDQEGDEEKEKAVSDIIGDFCGCFIMSEKCAKVYAISSYDAPIKYQVGIDCVSNIITRMYVHINEDYAYYTTGFPLYAAILNRTFKHGITAISYLNHEGQMLAMFEKYAKKETRNIEPNGLCRIEKKDMYPSRNETRLRIGVRDSRYFTECIRKEGFLVNGHLRLQPKKDENGNWTRELIYIDTFQKHGYHRRAQIDNQ